MTNDKPLYSYSSQGGMNLASGLLTLGTLFLSGIAFFFTAKIIGVFIGVALISVSYYALSHTAQRVDFFKGFAIIHYFAHKKPVEIKYKNIRFIQPVTQLRTSGRIFVAEMKNKKPVKKFAWHCSDKEFDEMRHLLQGNQIRIGRE